MKIYGILGTSQQIIVNDGVNYTPSEREIEMLSPRTYDDYIASASGTWVPDINKKLQELEDKYLEDRNRLMDEYNEAIILDDKEQQDSIRIQLIQLKKDLEQHKKEVQEFGENQA